jgi:hypothetical protein
VRQQLFFTALLSAILLLIHHSDNVGAAEETLSTELEMPLRHANSPPRTDEFASLCRAHRRGKFILEDIRKEFISE